MGIFLRHWHLWGESTKFSSQRVTNAGFDNLFVVRLTKRLKNQWRDRQFETPWHSGDITMMAYLRVPRQQRRHVMCKMWSKECVRKEMVPVQWRNNERVSNRRRFYCLLNRLFRRRSNKTSKLRVTGLWKGNSPVAGEFPAQRASNAENVFIWWLHHAKGCCSSVVVMLSTPHGSRFVVFCCGLISINFTPRYVSRHQANFIGARYILPLRQCQWGIPEDHGFLHDQFWLSAWIR